jgi:hypothetical protein
VWQEPAKVSIEFEDPLAEQLDSDAPMWENEPQESPFISEQLEAEMDTEWQPVEIEKTDEELKKSSVENETKRLWLKSKKLSRKVSKQLKKQGLRVSTTSVEV